MLYWPCIYPPAHTPPPLVWDNYWLIIWLWRRRTSTHSWWGADVRWEYLACVKWGPGRREIWKQKRPRVEYKYRMGRNEELHWDKCKFKLRVMLAAVCNSWCNFPQLITASTAVPAARMFNLNLLHRINIAEVFQLNLVVECIRCCNANTAGVNHRLCTKQRRATNLFYKKWAGSHSVFYLQVKRDARYDLTLRGW